VTNKNTEQKCFFWNHVTDWIKKISQNKILKPYIFKVTPCQPFSVVCGLIVTMEFGRNYKQINWHILLVLKFFQCENLRIFKSDFSFMLLH
jgi:hypothetical protein